MASGFFVLLDDIAALMDDVAVMSKVAAKKTAGILADDLAVNAEKSSGFVSSRELPVLWAIGKGSFVNKLIILPFAFLLSAYAPILITAALVLGGLYLAYEGAEKIFEYFFHKNHKEAMVSLEVPTVEEILTLEKEKIKSAIVTDFILSVEIVIIALGTVLHKPLVFQIMVVSVIAILATVGVYGIVALIVRMDEVGLHIIAKSNNKKSIQHKFGEFLVMALPKIIQGLAFVGTVALLLVSGGIFVHNSDFLHHLMPGLPSIIKEFLVGAVAGFVVLGLVIALKKIWLLVKK